LRSSTRLKIVLPGAYFISAFSPDSDPERLVLLWLKRQGQPLHFSELQHIVKSVSTWTWKKYTGRLSDKAFSELQAYRGRISAKTRASTAKVEGATLSKKMSALRSKGISEKQSWKALGISRAQWYRDQKALIDNDSQP
jgi:oligoribonuclease NrnB/cAMP/cGMP phosphodiesterase (DHH superfamily)